ncbi:MAG: hypothetical protein IJV98_05165 [Clostridia bacterium]|nr:hypothetical protein [Clostridia bacterium]
MKGEYFSEVLGTVGERYVTDAIGYRRKRSTRLMQRFGALASCIALLLTVSFFCRYLFLLASRPDGFVLLDTERGGTLGFGTGDVSMPPTYWENSLYARMYTREGTYETGEPFTVHFVLGLADMRLGAGDLVLRVDAKGLGAVSTSLGEIRDGTLVIPDFVMANYSKEEPLELTVTVTPDDRETWTSGTVRFSLYFRFDDAERFLSAADGYMSSHWYGDRPWHEYMMRDGMLSLGSRSISYADDGVELWTCAGAGGILERMLMNHYDTWRIDGKTFMTIYYEHLYHDRVYASVSAYREEDRTFRFSYISKNIRYEQTEFISDPVIWELYTEICALRDGSPMISEPPELLGMYRQMAEEILRYMRDDGILTEAEYREELAWFCEVEHIGNTQYMHNGKMGDYARKLRDQIYTHGD